MTPERSKRSSCQHHSMASLSSSVTDPDTLLMSGLLPMFGLPPFRG
jgi:hypothetical protein